MKEESPIGHLHPITTIIREVAFIFDKLGFSVVSGPELETEFHNFDALNVPPDHPARDMQDTFWIKTKKGEERKVLRTHTSPVQVRFMQKMAQEGPKPFKILVPGKVYRNEATDATHEAQFYQVEGLYVNERVSIAELKGVLEHMMKKLFGDDVEIRFRPSFFPFTEPSVEVDMRWNGKWLEMGGAGLVNPKVFEAAGLDSKKWQGFAFGFGVDRIAMLKFGYDDVRLGYTGDLRLINQF
ncbi:MAG: phenylalanine--tRNA ligase subunit alpha [Candidatus Taylorbacteria bacterium CG10_big_fil_rev_8_21_14_0_10_41_48]|uniref:phenylalanine--tRNA ligase n=1 Tax=Candidatus Taylorbacteria bacterium CG10_big_fil_rev_8_21_14_0_10_41_48 TaxID=1975024 RepID=A0A2M8LC76_9BACT|nr:MAG: phenylalanine--tRNA ligase subunit alpha [Candidatus Taylorbacteria bacterium CG10_big_fil_rev_8_21_14_0_10_41_48]